MNCNVLSVSDLIELLNTASENNPAFCPNGCGHSYKGTKKDRKNNLKRHMVYACGISPRFECIICLKKFTYKQSLKGHMLLVHRQILS